MDLNQPQLDAVYTPFRADAGSGRRGYGQDTRRYVPHRRVDPQPHQARPNSGRHLHQQGSRRNARAGWRAVGQEAGEAARDFDVPLALRAHFAAEHQAARLSRSVRHLRPRRPGKRRPLCTARDSRGRHVVEPERNALPRGPLEERLDTARAGGRRRPDRQGASCGRGVPALSKRLEGCRGRRLRRPAAVHRGTFCPAPEGTGGRGRPLRSPFG